MMQMDVGKASFSAARNCFVQRYRRVSFRSSASGFADIQLANLIHPLPDRNLRYGALTIAVCVIPRAHCKGEVSRQLADTVTGSVLGDCRLNPHGGVIQAPLETIPQRGKTSTSTGIIESLFPTLMMGRAPPARALKIAPQGFACV